VTKQTEAVNELRRMTVAELDDHLSKQRRRLFEVRFQQATGQVENHRQVREIRHEIARAMTVKIEIERGLRPAFVEPVVRAAPAKPKPVRAPRAAPRLEVPAAVPAAVPVAEAQEPAEDVAETVDAKEDVDE
jgi:large subunit ribosomal protein L29